MTHKLTSPYQNSTDVVGVRVNIDRHELNRVIMLVPGWGNRNGLFAQLYHRFLDQAGPELLKLNQNDHDITEKIHSLIQRFTIVDPSNN